jgi:hypothetical protein
MLDMASLRRFYLAETGGEESIFDVWERGEARGDSVTPSIYSVEYREWMYETLDGLLSDDPGGLVSIGSGNAVIEAALVRAGHRVLAVDVLEHAVELARSKGIDAVVADVRQWSPPPERWTVVYADGLLGHVYEPGDGVLPVLENLHAWLAPTEGTLVISNDRNRNGEDVEPAPGVPGFYWLSEEFLRKQTAAAGFHELAHTTFTYDRPVSGPRQRVVLTARA